MEKCLICVMKWKFLFLLTVHGLESHDLEADLNRDCVKMVAFSTTKGLSCGNWRSGIVFSRLDVGFISPNRMETWHTFKCCTCKLFI